LYSEFESSSHIFVMQDDIAARIATELFAHADDSFQQQARLALHRPQTGPHLLEAMGPPPRRTLAAAGDDHMPAPPPLLPSAATMHRALSCDAAWVPQRAAHAGPADSALRAAVDAPSAAAMAVAAARDWARMPDARGDDGALVALYLAVDEQAQAAVRAECAAAYRVRRAGFEHGPGRLPDLAQAVRRHGMGRREGRMLTRRSATA
jgi:hypothetical protein